MHPAQAKTVIRREKIRLRDALSPGNRQAFSKAIVVHLEPLLEKAVSVALYMPVRGEVEFPGFEGYDNLCLPVIPESGLTLSFRRWRKGEALEAGKYGILHPPACAAEVVPDVIVAPVVAFDRRGYRIGAGGGYYDATLARLRAARPVTFIGVAFSFQETARVPEESFDQPLNAVITERDYICV